MTAMTLQQAERRLTTAKQRAKALQEEISTLKETIVSLGGQLYPSRNQILERNKAIYKRWADGASYKELAIEFRLSLTRVSSVCKRIDRVLTLNDPERYPDFADLLPYKK